MALLFLSSWFFYLVTCEVEFNIGISIIFRCQNDTGF